MSVRGAERSSYRIRGEGVNPHANTAATPPRSESSTCREKHQTGLPQVVADEHAVVGLPPPHRQTQQGSETPYAIQRSPLVAELEVGEGSWTGSGAVLTRRVTVVIRFGYVALRPMVLIHRVAVDEETLCHVAETRLHNRPIFGLFGECM
jgi:hypothetical protein